MANELKLDISIKTRYNIRSLKQKKMILENISMLSPVFDRFVDVSPISVMARSTMERVLNPEQLDAWFDRTAKEQYTKDLLFSSVFDIMS